MEDHTAVLDHNSAPRDPEIPEMDESKLIQTIWDRPKQTLIYVINRCPQKFLWSLLILGGVASGLTGDLQSFRILSGGNLWQAIAIAIGSGAISGVVGGVIVAAVFRLVGKLLNGRGSFSKILTVVAWSNVPVIAGVVLFVLNIVFTMAVTSGSNYDPYSTDFSVFNMILSFVSTALWIWSMVIIVIGLSVANGFSIGKAILTFLIPIIVIAVPILIAAFVVGGFIMEMIEIFLP